ncbi:MFS transporter [Actinocatenispora comari]|uniref:MFS transporter n=1 Tax=Actinocatenispora comari TaxID=2807577 RepID=A0A8J4EP16_9ACTN|nr:MFS transporter [Actinocatenispora comari]GIL28284.1 MFS transporter [Actinocatenispora comari]
MRLLRAPGPDSLWRNRDFNLLWGSQALSDLGSSMSSLAYPLVILVLTHNAVLAGVVGTAAMIAKTAVRLPVGVLVDRVNRRRLMLGCDTIRLVAFAGLTVSLLLGYGNVLVILAVAVIESVCAAAFDTGAMSAVRNLVPLDQVPTAVARDEARTYAVGLVGPPIGGAVFGLGRALPFLADAISYLVSLVGLLLIRRPLQEKAKPADTDTSPLHDLLEGLRYTVTTPFLRAAMLIAAPLNFAINGMLFGIIILLQRNGTPPVLIGTVETIVGIGGLIGAIAASSLMRRFPFPALLRGITLIGVPLMLAALPLASTPLAAAPIALVILLGPPLNAGLFGHLAVITPDRLLGRVNSAFMTAAMGLAALAPVLAGALAEQFGATGVVLAFTAAFAVSTVVALTAKGIREMRPVTTNDPEQTAAAGTEPGATEPGGTGASGTGASEAESGGTEISGTGTGGAESGGAGTGGAESGGAGVSEAGTGEAGAGGAGAGESGTGGARADQPGAGGAGRRPGTGEAG